MAAEPRVLVVATTPGPAQALADAVTALQTGGNQVTVLSSSDSGFGRGCATFSRLGIANECVEDLLPQYRPLHVSLEQAADLLSQIAPDVLLAGSVNEPTGELRPLEDVLCAAASQANLPNLQFVEGWDVWQPRRWGPPPARIYLAADQYAAAMLSANGIDPRNIRHVGYSPSLLMPARLNAQERANGRATLGISGHERLIAFFGQVTPDNPTTLGWTAAALGPTDRLVFQPHPRDSRSVDDLLRNCPPGSAVLSRLRTDQLIQAADVCVTHFSLVSFATSALGLPTVLTLLAKDVPHVRSVLGAYPTTLLKGTTECYDCLGLRQSLANPRPPEQSFVDKVRHSAATFSDNLATVVLEAMADRPT